MNHIKELFNRVVGVAEIKSEYSDLLNYFISLRIPDSKGNRLSPAYISMLLAPFIRGPKDDRNYSLIYTLKKQCEHSPNPAATFWLTVKPKRK